MSKLYSWTIHNSEGLVSSKIILVSAQALKSSRKLTNQPLTLKLLWKLTQHQTFTWIYKLAMIMIMQSLSGGRTLIRWLLESKTVSIPVLGHQLNLFVFQHNSKLKKYVVGWMICRIYQWDNLCLFWVAYWKDIMLSNVSLGM